MNELIFNVTQEPDGGYCAMAVGEGIATQGDTWEELCCMVLDATEGYFFDSEPPLQIRLEPSGQTLHPKEAGGLVL